VVRWWFAGGSIMRLIACIMCLTIPAQLIVLVAVVRCAIAYNVRVIIPIRLIVIVCGGGVIVCGGGGVLYYRQKKAPVTGRVLS
jgi:hypothetical protein